MNPEDLILLIVLAADGFGLFLMFYFVLRPWKDFKKIMTPIQLALLGLISIIGIALLVSAAVLASAAYRYHRNNQNEKSLLARLQTAAEQTTGATPRKHPIDWSH